MSRRSKTSYLRGRQRVHVRNSLLALHGDVCAWCGRPLANDCTIDHVLPKWAGGGHDIGNLVLAHRTCNQGREPHYHSRAGKDGGNAG